MSVVAVTSMVLNKSLERTGLIFFVVARATAPAAQRWRSLGAR
jgi:hypothetical protein